MISIASRRSAWLLAVTMTAPSSLSGAAVTVPRGPIRSKADPTPAFGGTTGVPGGPTGGTTGDLACARTSAGNRGASPVPDASRTGSRTWTSSPAAAGPPARPQADHFFVRIVEEGLLRDLHVPLFKKIGPSSHVG